MKWRTIIEVAKILPDDATVTQAECTAAVEAARAICSLARTGNICFDIDGNLIEDHNKNKTRKRNEMKTDTGDRWKREEKTSTLSHSLSSSFQVVICDSDSAEEMNQKHFKLGTKPKWSAYADWSAFANWSNLSENSSATPISPWRDKSLWRITTTKTVEGLMSEQPSRGVTQKFESQYEPLAKKHAMEYSKLIKEFEEMKTSVSGVNEEDEAKEKGWMNKIEEILSLMKQFTGGINEQKVIANLEEGQKRSLTMSRK